MGPQNLNNYYFNKLDARLDYSSYYDFFLVADEKNYNSEVIYSPYPICVLEHEDEYLSGKTFGSDCLPVWIDLSSTGSTFQPTLVCDEYLEDNTLLSLSYWNQARPNDLDLRCKCPKCENSEFTGYTNFVESICDVGLTGVDNSLVKYMSGNTTELDWCGKKFTALSAYTGSVTATTAFNSLNDCFFTGATWSQNTPSLVTDETKFNFRYPCNNGMLSTTGSSSSDNYDFVRTGMTFANCCIFSGDNAYNITLSTARIISSAGTPNMGVFTAGTQINVGILEAPCKLETLKLWKEMPDKYKYDHLHYDRRFKMKQITGYSENNINYNIKSVTGGTEGYYQQLYGGFYQGFYKLYDYPYQVLPDRPECGWTFETLLKIRTNDVLCTGSTNTLNSIYPNNKGLFFYMGTRAENKFHNIYSAETGLQTCRQYDYSCDGNPIDINFSGNTQTNPCGEPIIITTNYDEKIDSWSNSFGLRLTPWNDGANSGLTLCYRALYFTGNCITTYSNEKVVDCERNLVYEIPNCKTGLTYTSGYTIVEKCTNTICDLDNITYRNEEPWVLVSARFKRNYCFEDCDLQNMGGVNDLIYKEVLDTNSYIDSPILGATTSLVREEPLMPGFEDQGNKVVVTGFYTGEGTEQSGCGEDNPCPPSSGCTSNYTKLTEKIRFTKLWTDDKKYRGGTLTLFVNGRPIYSDNNFEEIIPRRLNTEPQKQVGVPFNISWGGGTQGLLENQTFNFLTGSTSGTTGITYTRTTCPPYQQDPNDLGLLIEENFAGTYDGGISQMRYYIEPLGYDEIFHNFLVNKSRYDLKDCARECSSCFPCPVIYVKDCEILEVSLDYTGSMDEVAVDRFSQYIDNPPYVGAKFTRAITDNVTSYTITKYCCNGTGSPQTVTIPFSVLPTDVIKVDIVKTNNSLDSNVRLLGNLYQ